MEGIGNAGSALGVDASGMTVLAQALSRMEASGKASLEFLNMFQDRGINVTGMLAEHYGVDQGTIYDRRNCKRNCKVGYSICASLDPVIKIFSVKIVHS